MKPLKGGLEGISKARKNRPSFITLDAVMPGMDGWAVLSELKSDPALADIPVINEKRMGFTLGAPEFVTKPVDWKSLGKLIEKYRRDDGGYVLVVEDDVDTRNMLCRQLEKEAWDFKEAENGKLALDVIEEAGEPSLIIRRDRGVGFHAGDSRGKPRINVKRRGPAKPGEPCRRRSNCQPFAA